MRGESGLTLLALTLVSTTGCFNDPLNLNGHDPRWIESFDNGTTLSFYGGSDGAITADGIRHEFVAQSGSIELPSPMDDAVMIEMDGVHDTITLPGAFAVDAPTSIFRSLGPVVITFAIIPAASISTASVTTCDTRTVFDSVESRTPGTITIDLAKDTENYQGPCATSVGVSQTLSVTGQFDGGMTRSTRVVFTSDW